MRKQTFRRTEALWLHQNSFIYLLILSSKYDCLEKSECQYDINDLFWSILKNILSISIFFWNFKKNNEIFEKSLNHQMTFVPRSGAIYFHPFHLYTNVLSPPFSESSEDRDGQQLNGFCRELFFGLCRIFHRIFFLDPNVFFYRPTFNKSFL